MTASSDRCMNSLTGGAPFSISQTNKIQFASISATKQRAISVQKTAPKTTIKVASLYQSGCPTYKNAINFKDYD